MRRVRRGYSLVEMLIVLALTSAALGSLSWTVHALYRVERQVRDALTEDGSLDRFITQLRADAHVASAARLEAPEGGGTPPMDLVLEQAGQRVQFLLRPGSAERIVWRGESVVHRETFALPGAPAGWALPGEGTSDRVVLRLDSRTAATRRPAVPRPIAHIEVAVGLFRPAEPAEESDDDPT